MESEGNGIESDLFRSLMGLPETEEADMDWDRSQDWEIKEIRTKQAVPLMQNNSIDLSSSRPQTKNYQSVNSIPYIKQSYINIGGMLPQQSIPKIKRQDGESDNVEFILEDMNSLFLNSEEQKRVTDPRYIYNFTHFPTQV